jgi:hypothetical protein
VNVIYCIRKEGLAGVTPRGGNRTRDHVVETLLYH